MATYFGTEGNDSISGAGEPDNIDGFGGNDFLAGNGDNDFINGGSGNDTLFGDSGGDVLDGGTGNDVISGGSGQDFIVFREFGAANADSVSYDANWDRIQLDAAGFANIGASGRFAAGDVRFYAAPGATAGHDADDRIVYNTSTGQLFYDADGSSPGAAQLIATFQGAPNIPATDINVIGTATPSPTPPGTINGTSGDDTLIGTSGPDTINGLGGNDSIRGAAGADYMSGGDSNDTLDGLNRPTGGPTMGYNDVDVDTMDGGLGDDTYYVDNPGDVLLESGGIDTVISQNVNWTLGPSFENLTVMVDDEFGSGTGNELNNIIDVSHAYKASAFGMGGNDLLLSGGKNNLFGGDGNDTLVGNGSINFLNGGNGDDVLSGSVSDELTGGSGADNFLFNSPGVDVFINDFASASDRITLDAALMAQLGASGQFSPNDPRFFAGPAAHDADDRVIFTGGTLLYDPDGNGSQSSSVLAAFNSGSGANVVATDIWVINGTTPSPTPSPTPTPTPIPAGSMVGTAGNDNMQGTAGNDSIFGLAGNDTIFANGGNDWVQGGAGNDQVSGGSGQDIYAFAESGVANADTVANFDSGWDAVRLDAAGFSSIGATGRFAGGDVRFFAAAGATSGHDADDRIVYNTSTGQLFYDADGSGGVASQLIATFSGAPGIAATDITVFGTATPSPTPSPTPTPTPGSINGTEGNDSLVGTDANDTIFGFGGNDTIDGRGGVDDMFGGTGDDLYFVDHPSDAIVEDQNGGIDEVRSTAVTYGLPAWVNNLVLQGGAADGFGNAIENAITGNALANRLFGLDGNDTLFGMDANDSLVGGAGDDQLFAGNGDDTLQGGWNNDTMDGGAGLDFLPLEAGAQTPVNVNLAIGLMTGGDATGAARAVLSNIESVDAGALNVSVTMTGSAGNDVLRGGTQADLIFGGAGNDILYSSSFSQNANGDQLFGGDGDDLLATFGGSGAIINGGTGHDSLSSGPGGDNFVFDVAPGAANADQITSFSSGSDTIHLDATVMAALGGSGRFSAGDARFYAAPDAASGHDVDDRVVFNTTNGALWYDADGSGGAGAQLIATLANGATVLNLAATDIVVDNGATPTPTPTPGTTLNGTNGNDTLVGTAGNDTIFGNSGNDWLEGRGGNDQLSGGSGMDSYVFREFGAANADTLNNFDGNNWDSLRFDSGAFTALGGPGHFSAGDARFFAGAGATGGHDADDRIVYNTSSGQLYYDADGAGGADAQLVATIQGAAPVAAPDIWVI